MKITNVRNHHLVLDDLPKLTPPQNEKLNSEEIGEYLEGPKELLLSDKSFFRFMFNFQEQNCRGFDVNDQIG